jgi:RNA polymerase sigma factor (sigma-70 family)
MHTANTTTQLLGLLDRTRSGDPLAVNELVEVAYVRARRLAHRVLRDRFPNAGPGIETEDVLQVSLERFARKLREALDGAPAGLQKVPVNPAQMFAFLDRIIERVILGELRSHNGRKRRVQFPGKPLPVDLPDPREELRPEDIWALLFLKKVLDRLPEEERSLINLKYFWELSNSEIAEVVNCDPSTVSKRIYRILPKLRRMLEEERDGNVERDGDGKS